MIKLTSWGLTNDKDDKIVSNRSNGAAATNYKGSNGAATANYKGSRDVQEPMHATLMG
jgi:hypothetical protein